VSVWAQCTPRTDTSWTAEVSCRGWFMCRWPGHVHCSDSDGMCATQSDRGAVRQERGVCNEPPRRSCYADARPSQRLHLLFSVSLLYHIPSIGWNEPGQQSQNGVHLCRWLCRWYSRRRGYQGCFYTPQPIFITISSLTKKFSWASRKCRAVFAGGRGVWPLKNCLPLSRSP